jgi:DNA-binding LytR/AlgR family response regulator
MDSQLNILIVEDSPFQSAQLRKHLQEDGYQHLTVASSGERAIELYQKKQYDLLLLDIQMGGYIDGIEACKLMMHIRPVPHLYLTAFPEYFESAKITTPAAFFSKPYNAHDLRRAIELAIFKYAAAPAPAADPDKCVFPGLILSEDACWIRQRYEERERFLKVPMADIVCFKADNVYVEIHTASKTTPFIIVLTLSKLAEALLARPACHFFVQSSRSHIANLRRVTGFTKNYDGLHMDNGMELPVTESYRAGVKGRLG